MIITLGLIIVHAIKMFFDGSVIKWRAKELLLHGSAFSTIKIYLVTTVLLPRKRFFGKIGLILHTGSLGRSGSSIF